jgi:hypothetical protein
MSVDLGVQFLLEQASAQAQSSPREPMALLAELRASTSPQAVKQALIATGREPVPVVHVEDRVLPGPAGDIPIRLYAPKGS